MGRAAAGVKGIALRSQDTVVGAVVLKADDQSTTIMSVSANGYAKRTSADLYRVQTRGGKGIINFRVTSKTGPVVGALPAKDKDSLILLTTANKVIRVAINEIMSKGRATSGVIVARLDSGAKIAGFDRVQEGMPEAVEEEVIEIVQNEEDNLEKED